MINWDAKIPEVCSYGTAADYCQLPDATQRCSGVAPLDSLPAAWWNAMWHDNNTAFNCSRAFVNNIGQELCNIITCRGGTLNPNCNSQLYKTIFTAGTADALGMVKSSTCAGQVAIGNNGVMSLNCYGSAALCTTAQNLTGAINELKDAIDNFQGVVYSDATPLVDGAAAAGTCATAARGDHVHPIGCCIRYVDSSDSVLAYMRSGYNASDDTMGTNTLCAYGGTGFNVLSVGGLNGYNQLNANGNCSYNLLSACGDYGYNNIQATGCYGYNKLTAAGDYGYTEICTIGCCGYNRLITAAGYNQLFTDGGHNELCAGGDCSYNQLKAVGCYGYNQLCTTGRFSYNQLCTCGCNGCNLIHASGRYGYNQLCASGCNGFNQLCSCGDCGHNIMAVTGCCGYNLIWAEGNGQIANRIETTKLSNVALATGEEYLTEIKTLTGTDTAPTYTVIQQLRNPTYNQMLLGAIDRGNATATTEPTGIEMAAMACYMCCSRSPFIQLHTGGDAYSGESSLCLSTRSPSTTARADQAYNYGCMQYGGNLVTFNVGRKYNDSISLANNVFNINLDSYASDYGTRSCLYTPKMCVSHGIVDVVPLLEKFDVRYCCRSGSGGSYTHELFINTNGCGGDRYGCGGCAACKVIFSLTHGLIQNYADYCWHSLGCCVSNSCPSTYDVSEWGLMAYKD